VELTSEDY